MPRVLQPVPMMRLELGLLFEAIYLTIKTVLRLSSTVQRSQTYRRSIPIKSLNTFGKCIRPQIAICKTSG